MLFPMKKAVRLLGVSISSFEQADYPGQLPPRTLGYGSGDPAVLLRDCDRHSIHFRDGRMDWSDTFRERYYEPGYVYIAGSVSHRVLKIGTTVNIRSQERRLQRKKYGSIGDWVLLYHVRVNEGGRIEHDARRVLPGCRNLTQLAPERCPRSDRTGARYRSTGGSWSRESLSFDGRRLQCRSASCLPAGWQETRCRPG
jgi:hypothetical protein